MSSKCRAEIVAIGSELLSGAVVDTNSSLLARSFRSRGILVRRVRVVDDICEEIIEALSSAVEQSELVITTGGLGPTSDDLTRYALSSVSGKPLEQNQQSFSRLEEFLKKRGRSLSETNQRQVMFPAGAEILENRLGTADAFVTLLSDSSGREVPVISLPGVPKELELLLEEKVLPWCAERFAGLVAPESRYLRCFGVSEASLGTLIEGLSLTPEINVAYRPQFPEILLTLECDSRSEDAAKMLERAKSKISDALGQEFVVSEAAQRQLPDVVLSLLRERGLRLALAESCSGGLIAHQLVSRAGASEVFEASLVTYSNAAKEVFLGAGADLLERYGAVSPEIAVEMARGAKYRIGADIAVSVTGIAGPDGGTEKKPVGTVWFGIANGKMETAVHRHLPWDRDYVRKYSAAYALDLVRRSILGYPLDWQNK